jgi:hypothetical protein
MERGDVGHTARLRLVRWMFFGDAWKDDPPRWLGRSDEPRDALLALLVVRLDHTVFEEYQWYIRGVHVGDYGRAAFRLKQLGQRADAEEMWLHVCACMEESERGPFYAPYEALAILYAQQDRTGDAIAICERFLMRVDPASPAAYPIARRLEKLRPRDGI